MFEQKFDKWGRTALQRTTLNQKRALLLMLKFEHFEKVITRIEK